MSVEIQWLGHASFRIAGAEAIVYIDPWKLQIEPHDADLVVISHSHYDHFSPDDIEKVSKADTADHRARRRGGQAARGQRRHARRPHDDQGRHGRGGGGLQRGQGLPPARQTSGSAWC